MQIENAFERFLKELPICITHFGVRSLIRKYFYLSVLVEREEYLLVQATESISLEMSKRNDKKSHTLYQECKLIQNGTKCIIWQQQKTYRKKYYAPPVLTLPECGRYL